MRALAAAALLAALHSQPAAAQRRPTDADLAEARARFQEGLEEVQQSRWADALRSFERSYALAPVGATLFNLGTTLRALGRDRDARDAFDRLLERHSDLPADLRSRATTMRAESAARVAVLSLVDLPADPRAEVSLDGAPRPDDGERPLPLETDAGDHALVVEVAGYHPFRWQGRVADGARLDVPVQLEPDRRDPREEDGGSLPLWLGVAGGAVLVAGVVLAIVVITGSTDLQPNGDLVLRL
jgi:tetratricopeptide (TPR) repeat protein